MNGQFTHLLLVDRLPCWKQNLLTRGKEIHLNLDLDLLSPPPPPRFLSEIENRRKEGRGDLSEMNKAALLQEMG